MASLISTAQHPNAHPAALPQRHFPRWAWPRRANAVLGAWLALSAFVWEHSLASQVNAFVVGIWIATAALWAARSGPLRIANTVIALWLGAATLAMSEVPPVAYWNNLAVAVLAFSLSLIPSPEAPRSIAVR
jgi:hypothetical protein